ncbi:MAG: flagellar hook-length control protein FliK [Magnetococcales bacterium]|nr:flagellar hook-length control protein FliK [Magnetococcales bacterium]
MILSGVPLPPGETAPVSSNLFTPPSPPELLEGRLLVGRISQLSPDGHGVIRFPNGSGFSFSGGQSLRVGEQVTLEVTRLVPEIGVRLVASESGSASALAQNAEQSLARAPDLMGRLMVLTGLSRGGATGSALTASLGGRAPVLLVGRESLASVIQRALPNLSAEALFKGDLSGLTQLLEGGSRQEVTSAVRLVRQAADLIQQEAGKGGGGGGVAGAAGEGSEVAGARHALQRLGDLLAMQQILPHTAPAPEDGAALLGYRLFWLNEGGLGEVVWRKEREKRKRGGRQGDESVLSVLLSLNMTRLGTVQARLVLGEGMLAVGIAAGEEETLSALRGDIGALRQGLLAAGLPLRALDLTMLGEGGMKAERAEFLGMGTTEGGGGFRTEA